MLNAIIYHTKIKSLLGNDIDIPYITLIDFSTIKIQNFNVHIPFYEKFGFKKISSSIYPNMILYLDDIQINTVNGKEQIRISYQQKT